MSDRLAIGHVLAEGHDPFTCETCRAKRREEREAEVGRAGALVAEIVDGRANGKRDSLSGHSDEDLLAAIEEVEGEIAAWRAELREQEAP